MDEINTQDEVTRRYFNSEDILREAKAILEKHNFELSEQFEVANSKEELEVALDNFKSKNLDLKTRLFAIIFNLKPISEPPSWNTLIMFKLDDDLTRVVYKDSLGGKINVEVKEMITSRFESIREDHVLSHYAQEQEDACTSGQLALKNLDILFDHFKKDRNDLINNYHRVRFAHQSDIQNGKSECPEQVKQKPKNSTESKIDKVEEPCELVQVVIEPPKVKPQKLIKSSETSLISESASEKSSVLISETSSVEKFQAEKSEEMKKETFEETSDKRESLSEQTNTTQLVEELENLKTSSVVQEELTSKSSESSHSELAETKSSTTYSTKETQTCENATSLKVSIVVNIPVHYEHKKSKPKSIEIPIQHVKNESNDLVSLRRDSDNKRRNFFVERVETSDFKKDFHDYEKKKKQVRIDVTNHRQDEEKRNTTQQTSQAYIMNELKKVREEFEKRRALMIKQFDNRFRMFRLDSKFNEIDRCDAKLSIHSLSDEDNDDDYERGDDRFKSRALLKSSPRMSRQLVNDYKNFNDCFEEYNFSQFNYSSRYSSF